MLLATLIDVWICREVADEIQTLVHLQSSHHSTPPSFRLWPMLLLPCLRSASRTPIATCWTSILRTSTSCWRPWTSAQSGDRSSSWTACPTTTPRTSVRPKGTAVTPTEVWNVGLWLIDGCRFLFVVTLPFPPLTFKASASASLPGYLTPTQPWCCRLSRCWWNSWSFCPRTPTTTTPCWRSCPRHWSPYSLESLRSSTWLWGTSTSSFRRGVWSLPGHSLCCSPLVWMWGEYIKTFE